MSAYEPVSDAMAREVACPRCHARKEQPCTYLSDGEKSKWNGPGTWTYTIRSWKAGEPCQRVHNERRNSWYVKMNRARRREWEVKAQAAYEKYKVPPAALFTLRALDVAEYGRTKDWLREHGHILWARPRNSPMTREEKTAFSSAWDARVKESG